MDPGPNLLKILLPDGKQQGDANFVKDLELGHVGRPRQIRLNVVSDHKLHGSPRGRAPFLRTAGARGASRQEKTEDQKEDILGHLLRSYLEEDTTPTEASGLATVEQLGVGLSQAIPFFHH